MSIPIVGFFWWVLDDVAVNGWKVSKVLSSLVGTVPGIIPGTTGTGYIVGWVAHLLVPFVG